MPALLRVIDELPPGSGAVVMGTGILSTALLMDGALALSRILLVLTAAIWIALAGVLFRRLAVGRDRLRDEASSPAGLTGVAGTAVLGTRLIELGWGTAGMALPGSAFAAWCALLPIVLGRLRGRADGVAFMVTVATEGIATLAAAVGSAEHSGWLVDAAVPLAGA